MLVMCSLTGFIYPIVSLLRLAGVCTLVSLLCGLKSDTDPWSSALTCAEDSAACSDLYKVTQAVVIFSGNSD